MFRSRMQQNTTLIDRELASVSMSSYPASLANRTEVHIEERRRYTEA